MKGRENQQEEDKNVTHRHTCKTGYIAYTVLQGTLLYMEDLYTCVHVHIQVHT